MKEYIGDVMEVDMCIVVHKIDWFREKLVDRVKRDGGLYETEYKNKSALGLSLFHYFI